ncbi:MAG: DUF2586 domain-containing protein [Prevotellaceae bacterium]|jgi:hypothetical protein|nr:DUF2586 domain-containing protein [Prevotellaceae bacterium]
MNKLTVTRTNGNVPKSLPGEDHISGLLIYSDSNLPAGFSNTDRIKAISTIETAEGLGITSAEHPVIYNLLKDIFRINPGISLYAGIFETSADFAEVKTMQNFAEGRLRQIGVYNADVEITAANVTALQAVATQLEAEDTPLSILYYPKVTNIATLPAISATERKNVSVVVALNGLGIVLGIVSAAKVNESIAWVKRFPTGVESPAFSDGTLLKNVDKAVIETIDTKRYLFFVTYPGLADSYLNDSHTCDLATSDYAYIELVRTMDKAVRGVRTYLLPELGGNIYIDSDTGKLQAYSIKNLELVAGKAIEDMEKAGEISGYSVEIDPEQNVLSTSTVEIVIKQVSTGVMRKINVKIGYTEKL